MKIQLGFVPLADCAPLVAAHQLGHFGREGLEVDLRKIQSWPQLLSRLQEGLLEGAHLLSTLPVLVAAGAPGLEAPLCTAWTLSSSANAITLSNRLWREGVATATDLATWLDSHPGVRLHLGIVLPRSTQELALREWLAQGGLEIGERIELVTCPPQEMTRRLREDLLDGFCSGEPWNQRAATSKLGGIVALGDTLLPGAPEKVLAVRSAWHQHEPEAHAALLRALDSASVWLEDPAHLDDAARMLADKSYVNTQEPLLRSALERRLQAGWKRTLESDGFLRFTGINAPTEAGFRYLLERLVWWGHLPSTALETDLSRVCLEEFHRKAFAIQG